MKSSNRRGCALLGLILVSLITIGTGIAYIVANIPWPTGTAAVITVTAAACTLAWNQVYHYYSNTIDTFLTHDDEDTDDEEDEPGLSG